MSRFRFRPVLTVFTVIGVGVLLSLGTWQVKRLQWKLDLIEKVEARTASSPVSLSDAESRRRAGEDLEYQPVRVSGTFDHDLEVHVFGTWEGQPGWYIMTPLRLTEPVSGQDRLVVNRGFVPDRLQERDVRPDSLIAGEVTVTGLYRSSKTPRGVSALVSPSDMAPKDRNEFYSRDVEAFSHHLDVALMPFLIDVTGAEPVAEDWPRAGTTRLVFNNRHLEYALTWYGLAATLIAVFFIFSRKPVSGPS